MNEKDRTIHPYQKLIEERAEDLYEDAPCGYLSSLPNGTIVKINQTLLDWLGYAREEVLFQKKVQDLLSIGGKIFYETHHAPLIRMQGTVNELAYELLRRDGSLLPVLLNSRQVTDADGKPVIDRTMVVDITDRKKYEAELLRAKKKAEEAARIKSEFLSTVSHEIRTPLNAIIGVTHLLFNGNPRPDQTELLRVLRSSSEHLLHLINDILDFNKIESGKVTLEQTAFDLKGLVYNTLYGLSIKAEEKDLRLETRLDEDLPTHVLGDPVKIGQVLTNLLSNAVKFTDHGSITLELRVLSVSEQGTEIEFSVVDTGIGIALEKQERIFEEFTQADYSINVRYGGTGLGLAICRKLLELYGSRLGVESEVGVGSRFYFTLSLPRAEAPAEPSKMTHVPDQDTSLHGVHLLLVEDNDVNVFILAQFLRQWGVTFDVAVNGLEALDLVQTCSYALVLMDLQMPEMDGYEASIRIRALPDERFQHLPIVALSASARIDIEQRLARARIDGFISKPFHPLELFRAIATYSGRATMSAPGRQPAAEPQPFPMSASAPPAASIDLTECLQVTDGNEAALRELLQLLIDSFEDYHRDFERVLQEKDDQALADLHHKIKVTLELLRAHRLDELIQEARRLVANDGEPLEQPTAVLLLEEIDRAIGQLRERLA